MPITPRYKNEMNEAIYIFLVFSFVLILSLRTSDEDNRLAESSANQTINGIQFTENKGQWHNNIEFLTGVPNNKMYIDKNAISYIYAYFQDSPHTFIGRVSIIR